MNQTASRSPSRGLLAVPIVLLLCWALPRLVVAVFGIDGVWTPFFYQYLLGGIVFGIGLLVIRVSGACDMSRAGARVWFRALVYGYLAYAAMHGVITWLAVSVPFRGQS